MLYYALERKDQMEENTKEEDTNGSEVEMEGESVEDDRASICSADK